MNTSLVLRSRLSFVLPALLAFACASIAHAAEADGAKLEAQKQNLLKQITSLTQLIDANPDAADADRKRDVERRDKLVSSLGQVVVELAGVVAPVASAPKPGTGSDTGTVNTEPPSPKEIETAAQKLWQKGREVIAALPRNQRDVYLRYNLRQTASEAKNLIKEEKRKAGLVHPLLAMFSKQGFPSPDVISFSTLDSMKVPKFTDTACNSAEPEPIDRANQLLVRVGYNKLNAAQAELKQAMTPAQNNAVVQFGKSVADTPPAQDADVILRKRGISFTQGAGVVLGRNGSDDKAVGTLLARWNLNQRRATAIWNQRIGDANPDGDIQVTHDGQIEYSLPGYGTYAATPFPRDRDQGSWFQDILMSPSFFGPLVGGTIIGDKLAVPGGAANDRERPYLIGWGVGFSYFREAAPLVYIDAAKTISPSKGFKGSSTYIGVSFDAIVLGKILQGIRGRPTFAAPAPAAGSAQ